MQTFFEQLAAQSLAESIAVVLALAYVWLAARENIWCWPCAMVSTGIYIWLFWDVNLPFNSALNGYFLVMAVYGWLKWKQGSEQILAISQWSWHRHVFSLLSLTLLSVGISYLVAGTGGGALFNLDVFVTVFSVFTTVLVAHKILENWLYWIVIDGFAAYLYFSKDLVLTSVLYVGYLGFAIYGYWHWKNEMNKQNGQSADMHEQSNPA